MAWYYGVFSCGHEGKTNITGPTKNRKWIAEKRFEGVCEECYKKQLEEERNKANEEAKAKAEEMELVELEGTEKQVAWANTLRLKMINKFEEEIEILERKYEESSERFKERKKERLEVARKVLDYITANKNKATFYIDTRGDYISELIEKYKDEASNNVLEDKRLENEVINESIIAPEEIKFDGIVKIKPSEDKIEVFYEKNETFREIVKGLKYKWDSGCWNRKINESTGSYIDRAAELGNVLLNEGFMVSILDVEIREKAINGDFEHECDRWIFKSADDKLKISWDRRNNDLYSVARKIPTAKWSSGVIVVNISKYRELEEFAEMYGFSFSKLANKMIEKYKYELENIEKVKPVKVSDPISKNGLEDILNSSREVLDDLMEDD